MIKLSIKFFLISIFVFFATGSLFADSPCKGLSESSCNSNNDCTWVNGYKKDDGTKVDDYCRAKPGKGDDDDDSKSDKKDKKKKKDKDDDDDSKSDKKDKKKKKDKDDNDDSKSDKKDKKKKKNKKGDD